MLKKGTCLFVKGIHKVGGVLHLDLNLIVDLLAFRGLLGSDLLLTGKLVFSCLKLLTSGLGLVDQIGVVSVDLVQQLPILSKLGERGGAEQKVDERGGAGAVHAAGARAQTILQTFDFLGGLVDLYLLLLHGALGALLLIKSCIVVFAGGFQIGLQADQLVANGIRLGLLFSGRFSKRELGDDKRRGAKRCCAADECSPAEIDYRLAHPRTS